MQSESDFVQMLVASKHLQITGFKLFLNQFQALFMKCVRFKMTLFFLCYFLLVTLFLGLTGYWVYTEKNDSNANHIEFEKNYQSNQLKPSQHLFLDFLQTNFNYKSYKFFYSEELGVDSQLVKDFKETYLQVLSNCQIKP